MSDMLPHLRDVLMNARKRAEASQVAVARLAGVDNSNISRFEAGEAEWPNNPDDYVSAYATLAGCEPVDLWRRAVRLMEHSAR